VSSKILTTYLNDHLAGSVAALELLDHMISLDQRSSLGTLSELRMQVEQDQKVLQDLLRELGARESAVRKAAAWLTEKLGQAKLKFDDPGDGDLRMLEALETLGLGIQGKLALWRALASVAGRVPQLGALDLQQLQRRATDQLERVEALRIQAARTALTP
jgi:hypothetical protein